MPFIRPVEIPFFPRLPQISPWFILWGLLFSALLSTSLSSFFFPSYLFGRATPNNNIRGHIRPSGGPEFEFDRIAHLAGNEIAGNAHVAARRVQHRDHTLPSPTTTVAAATASTTTNTTTTTTTTTADAFKQPLITRSPPPPPLSRRDDRFDEYDFPHFGDDEAESRLANGVNVYDQPIQTVHLQDVRPFPLGEVNDIPGVFAACAQPCMKKAVELNTDCKDPLDLECTCRPEKRAVIEAASDECCWQACGGGVPEILWRPCWNDDNPLHY
ncbi:hypothetical protein B0H65DRAFT_268937 [Neurospora tetraspora]|uniref:CFEM domain-containing protein n=1 Tax=Neurospora tetraspora TaxID=94610 RepID=A0AAE0JB74_9PEZI|nr:hypothetical protein B0H65DRAFT_268937 [Neurospora tetraspora]